MRRLVSYMFTSLVGFIADRDGGLDWVPIDDELMRFANAFFGAAGAIVFGRKVHDGFVSYWDQLDPSDPSVTELEAEFARIFSSMERIVVSTTARGARGGPIVLADDLPAAIGELKGRPGGDLLLICGPELRSTLAGHGLIDRYRSLVAPVALGEGVPQFSPMGETARLRLVDSSTFGGGVVMLDHEPA